MTFAGALTITDLDDFLTPSQACIIPVRQSNKPAGQETGDNANTEIQIDADNNYYEVSTHSTALAGPSSGVETGRQALKKAEISLNDCLACSGCITSTESLLITMQSHNEVLDYIRAGDFDRVPVLSIAPQTLASLSASYSGGSIPLRTLLRRIRAFLSASERGSWRVWDTTFARHVSLQETLTEFGERKAAAERGEKMSLPMLASACPGWVCYAEKAQGDLLPLLSATRSAQGVMGALVKQFYASKLARNADQVYHVTAMPCYDKKLEASREDFYSEAFKTRDTDCVLTTGELDLLLHELGFDPLAPVPGEDAEFVGEGDVVDFPELLQHPGSSSGSYLGTLLSALAAAHRLPTRVHKRAVRGSSDNVEVYLEDVEGNVLFKGAICYGFRNLQNLVRKVGRETGLGRARPAGAGKLQAAVAARRRKARTGAGEIQTPATPATPTTPGSTPRSSTAGDDVAGAALVASRDAKKLDFVEVMACPGGCVNGGGQMKPSANGKDMGAVDAEGYPRPLADDGVAEPPRSTGLASEEGMRWSTKEWVAEVERVYWTGLPTPPSSPRLGIEAQDTAPAQWPARTRAADATAVAAVQEMVDAAGGDRFKCVRTSFKRVEGDVLSQGGLTHEQVKW